MSASAYAIRPSPLGDVGRAAGSARTGAEANSRTHDPTNLSRLLLQTSCLCPLPAARCPLATASEHGRRAGGGVGRPATTVRGRSQRRANAGPPASRCAAGMVDGDSASVSCAASAWRQRPRPVTVVGCRPVGVRLEGGRVVCPWKITVRGDNGSVVRGWSDRGATISLSPPIDTTGRDLAAVCAGHAQGTAHSLGRLPFTPASPWRLLRAAPRRDHAALERVGHDEKKGGGGGGRPARTKREARRGVNGRCHTHTPRCLADLFHVSGPVCRLTTRMQTVPVQLAGGS
ncbi:MAG: hypothetical protein FE78DRAFT_66091 [Acidomyces sp. 'richmondensis']|nr:MAG: hypothetical protein FE78DRAFT_66091 [Acidomyces sp. 'richmondensis']